MNRLRRLARAAPALTGLAFFSLGYACGGGGEAALAETMRLFEFGGARLDALLEQAGPPTITTPVGIAETVPEDGTRHFTLTVATENREARSDVAALYAEVDGYGDIGSIWGGNLLAFAHSNMTSGTVQGLEVDVGNLGTEEFVPVAGINIFAVGPRPSDVALGILNGTSAGPGGFRQGIAFRSAPGGSAVTEALMRVQPGFGRVRTGIDLIEAEFEGAAIASPGFRVGPTGDIQSDGLATGRIAYACVSPSGGLFASASPCVP